MKLLIQFNANIELQNKVSFISQNNDIIHYNNVVQKGRTGLMIAAWRGHSSIVAELVRAGAQIDAQDQVYNLYVLLCLVSW